MERHKKDKRHRKKAPRVPIKTYKWEDIRRERLRGGYPWTYLYKEPFDENIDPKLFKMEAMSKSKSSSPLPKPSETLDIKEITEETNNLIPEPSGYIVITEVPSDSESHSKNITEGSVTIEDVGEPETTNLESAESSDNISQYLDKEEVVDPVPTSTKIEENGRQERAKSEEPKRKRKLSIDSSYSRKSLSKLAIMKKLKEAKDKIKVPKLSLPKSLKQPPEKSTNKPETKPKDVSKLLKPDPNLKPVYIHIPLKPPEGETDEFSYLEFGEKKPEPPKIEEKPQEEIPKIEIEASFNEERRFSGDPDDIVAFEILKTETIDLDHANKNGLSGGSDYLIIQQDDDAKSENMIIIMPGEESSTSQGQSPSRQGSRKIRAKSAEPERKRRLSVDSSSSLSKLSIMQKLKEFKLPKLSLSRSGSKKGQEKKTEPKEIKDTKPEVKKVEPSSGAPKYIHIPLKPPPGHTDEFSHLEFEEKKEIQLEDPPKVEDPSKVEESSVESPTSPKTEGVQFIFLTPPSDDEVLKEPEIPETPSSETSDESRLTELKKLAKDAVEKVSPESQKKVLQPVEEEADSKSLEEEKSEKMVVDEEDGLKLTESAMALQEQNIKAKEVAEVSELKSSLKTPESPVLKKKVSFKRRSRDDSKDTDYEEVQAPEKDEAGEKKKLDVLENNQSMSVDEEKSYLDEEKIIKSTSLEEDYNRWSKLRSPSGSLSPENVIEIVIKDWKETMEAAKPAMPTYVGSKKRRRRSLQEGQVRSASEGRRRTAKRRDVSRDSSTGSSVMSLDVRCACQYFQCDSLLPDRINPVGTRPSSRVSNMVTKFGDHEYEPVNPPPDIPSVAPPTVHVIDSEQNLQPKPISLASSTTSLDRRMLGSEPPEPTIPDYTVQEIQTEIETKYFSKTPVKQETTVHTVTVTQKPTKPKSEGPSKLQQAFKTQTDKFKTKLHEIKLPPKPHLKKPNFKFEKPKFNLPKIPDSAKVNLPSFSLPRRKRSLKQRQYSTESNAGDSKTNYFDFRTYPRLFKKKPKDDFDSFAKNEREVSEFATVPRTKRKQESDDRWGGRDSIRIPLHSEDSMEESEDMASHIRYDQDIDIDDAYEKENQEIHCASPFSHNYNSRWDHGSFHPEPNQQVTDLDSPIDKPQPHESFDTNTSKDIHSSESSLGIHRRGVLEEIDSDEFFLRQKGISQDNIEVGMYLSSEIREAFKSPNNALNDLQNEPYSYETRASNTSLPETPSKRKVVKKPKRKKTPHVSQEQLSFDQDSELELEIPPSRPKRRSRRSKKKEEVIPYQETIAVEVPEVGIPDEDEDRVMYENEQMEGKEQPEIKINDPYTGYDSEDEEFKDEEKPMAPPRKHRSLKSLNYSEHESILGDFNPDQDTEVYKTEHEYIIPTPEEPPIRPSRTLSRSSSKSIQDEPPARPARSRSRTRSRAESLTEEQPCVEETCVQDFRDYMGYAIVDKNNKREPPLPPPKTPPRRKRSIQSEQKFFTVPRPVSEEPPVRPLRNYSTLGPSRPPRRKHPVPNMTDEEKENIDITQYIEIDDEPNRDLHSGKVIQKMKDRPLPAPPRPPRNKLSKPLQDITSQENVAEEESGEKGEVVDETEVSTQTEEVCEPETMPKPETVITKKQLITPTNYTYEEETITHGTLVVEPLNGAKILPDHEFTRIEKPKERTIPVEEEDEETSEIPEEFTKLKDPPPVTVENQPTIVEKIIERPVMIQPDSNTEVEVLKAQKLQVSDLDVDRLNVNELLASRIVVSEIDSGSIQTNELSSKSGALKVGEIELPPSLVQQLLEKLQSVVPQPETENLESASGTTHPEPPSEASSGQKKTPIEQVTDVPPQRPPRKSSLVLDDPPNISVADSPTDPLTVSERPPEPPVRSASIEDTPPPRPPDPIYVPSQPPASFYALRAQQFVDEDIPMAPRRRRHRKTPVSRSSSDETPPPARRRVRSPEPSISQLTGQLVRACGAAANCSIKRLIAHIRDDLIRNADGQQDLHVMMVILLVLIAGLILLAGDGKTVHHHHWEFFNPPRDM